MASFNSGFVEGALKKKGFKEEKNHNHKIFVFIYQGKITRLKTKISHCNQEIDNYLIGCMKKDLHLSKDDFFNLINCPLSEKEYIDKMVKQNLLP